jgi:hypothetical protein
MVASALRIHLTPVQPCMPGAPLHLTAGSFELPEWGQVVGKRVVVVTCLMAAKVCVGSSNTCVVTDC